MEKLDNVIDALRRCLDGDDACPGCYLNDCDGCRDRLNLDALDHLTVYQDFLSRCGEGGELVRRSDVLKFPIRRDHCDKENANPHFINGIETVMEYMEFIPVVEAEPVVHAHWVTWTEEVWHLCEKRMMDRHYCSACGEPFVTKVKRCPECGAHMDEGVAE